jgi:hypothetical protein
MAAISTLVDNFAVNDLGTLWANSTGVTWAANQVQIAAGTSFTSSMQSTASYNLTGSSFYARLIPWAGDTSGSQLGMDGYIDYNNLIGMYYLAGSLYCYYVYSGGAPVFSGSPVTYNAVTHAYWRIRHSGSTIYWDTSPDSVSWTNLQSHANPGITITSVYPSFWGGDTGSGSGTAFLLSVNTPSLTPYGPYSEGGTGTENQSVLKQKVVSSSDSGTGFETPSRGFWLASSGLANSGATSVSSQAVTLNNVLAGDLVVACVACAGNALTVTGPAGWVQAVTNQPASPASVQTSIWYAIAGTPGSNTWTFSSSLSVPMAVTVAEFTSSSGWQPVLLDKTAQGNVKAVPSTSSTVDSGTTPLTAQVSELWVASLAWAGVLSFTGTTWRAAATSYGSSVSMSELYQAVPQPVGSADCAVQLPVPVSWAGCAATFMPVIPVSVSSSDSGTGSDAYLGGNSSFGSGPYGYGIYAGPAQVVANVPVSDTGAGADSHVSPLIVAQVSSSDSGTGSDTHQGPALVYVSAPGDYGIGSETLGSARSIVTAAMLAFDRTVFEGFSLSRCSVLGSGTYNDGTYGGGTYGGPGGTEASQLYGAQSISIVPSVTSSDMKADDDEIGVWFYMNKAAITVVNGFMSWNTISLLSGVSISSTGTSPNDYYGLPLWTQYQHNRPTVSMAFRMMAKNSLSTARTLDFVLYRVQLSVTDYTGVAYKQGLGVSYSGTVLFSSVDEAGNALSGPQIGRIVSSPGVLTGAIGPVYD